MGIADATNKVYIWADDGLFEVSFAIPAAMTVEDCDFFAEECILASLEAFFW
jgi:hypothetical protein